jgi:hypothetical protein
MPWQCCRVGGESRNLLSSSSVTLTLRELDLHGMEFKVRHGVGAGGRRALAWRDVGRGNMDPLQVGGVLPGSAGKFWDRRGGRSGLDYESAITKYGGRSGGSEDLEQGADSRGELSLICAERVRVPAPGRDGKGWAPAP